MALLTHWGPDKPKGRTDIVCACGTMLLIQLGLYPALGEGGGENIYPLCDSADENECDYGSLQYLLCMEKSRPLLLY